LINNINNPKTRPTRTKTQAKPAEQSAFSCPDAAAPYRLSDRELTVLYLLSEGLSDKQIALALGVTNYTVNKHVGAVLAKMDARSRTGAAVMAIRQHLFDDTGRGVRGHPARHSRRIYGPAA
jgi:DNA-binding NarL/FixJ family response regulator